MTFVGEPFRQDRDIRLVRRQLARDGGVTDFEGRFCEGHETRGLHGDDRVTRFGLSADVQYIARDLCFEAIGDLGDAEVFRDLGADLSGVAVDRLLAAEDGVEGTFLFRDQLDRL